VAARSKACVYGRSLDGIVGSNLSGVCDTIIPSALGKQETRFIVEFVVTAFGCAFARCELCLVLICGVFCSIFCVAYPRILRSKYMSVQKC